MVAHLLPIGRTVAPLMRVSSFDEFGDPIPVTVSGYVVAPPEPNFPDLLEGPMAIVPSKATITPFADASSIMFADLQQTDAIAAFFLGIALLLGPDYFLAPTGLVSGRGIRPGYALEAVVGSIIDDDAQWLKDRNEGLQADAPLFVRAPIFVVFLAAGLLLNRLLLVALEDSGFVISMGICSCFGAAIYDVIRQPLPTRAERDLDRTLADEFLVFSSARLSLGRAASACHEREIIAAFRKYYPRYRYADMEQTADGTSVTDRRLASCIRKWNISMGAPAERTSAGYWKGIELQELEAAANAAAEGDAQTP